MGEHLSTLRNIVGIIRDCCDILHTIDENLARPGEGIIVKTKNFLISIRWYVFTPIAIIATAYFLPDILKRLADWINSMRSSSTEFQNAWNGTAVNNPLIGKVIGKLASIFPEEGLAAKFFMSS